MARPDSMKACRISAGVAPGAFWSMRAATAAALGAAEDVPKNAQLFTCDGVKLAYRLVLVTGGSTVVSDGGGSPKNVVLLPSVAVITGFCACTCLGRGLPFASRVRISGPYELNDSERIGVWMTVGYVAHQGMAPTPIVAEEAVWAYDVG